MIDFNSFINIRPVDGNMNNDIALTQALSMDLLRTAIGLNRKSTKMAEIFGKEAQAKVTKLDGHSSDKHLDKLILLAKKELKNNLNEDNLLMCSTLFRNYTLKNM